MTIIGILIALVTSIEYNSAKPARYDQDLKSVNGLGMV